MGILGQTTTKQFIEQFWQKEPLLVRQALTLTEPLVDGNELAGLACEDWVESRLVLCDAQQAHWRCEDGPFAQTRFGQLPATHWTLLVQGVDQHDPMVHRLLNEFNFLPRWRLDDIMISYAVDGGGVGAHFDYYDVFLLQLHGQRRWQIGQRCDENTPLRDDAPLKLLNTFHAQCEYIVDAGDMLYLPPGLAHCGTALGDDCVTASIGYRSPSMRALAEGALDVLAAMLPDRPGYRDNTQSIDADPFRINSAALAIAQRMTNEVTPAQIAQALARAFGIQVTEPRQVDLIEVDESLQDDAFEAHLQQHRDTGKPLLLRHHRASRFAYCDSVNTDYVADAVLENDVTDDHAVELCLLFVDGELHRTSLAVARGICHERLSAATVGSLCNTDCQLLLRLINQGSLSLER